MICISVHRMYSILYTYNMKYEYIDSQAGFQTGPSRGSKCASEIQISPWGLCRSRCLDYRHNHWGCQARHLIIKDIALESAGNISSAKPTNVCLSWFFPMPCNLHQTSMNTTNLKKKRYVIHPLPKKANMLPRDCTLCGWPFPAHVSCYLRVLDLPQTAASATYHVSYVHSDVLKAKLCQDSSFISRFKEPQRHLSRICRACI